MVEIMVGFVLIDVSIRVNVGVNEDRGVDDADQFFNFSSLSLLPPVASTGLRFRSGNGLVGARPNLNSREPSWVGVKSLSRSQWLPEPEPVEPTKVTELRLDGDDGPLSKLIVFDSPVNVSTLLDVVIIVVDAEMFMFIFIMKSAGGVPGVSR